MPELGPFLHQAGVDVPAATEIHFSKAEFYSLPAPSNEVADECSLVPDQQRMRGGVVIKVRKGPVYEDIEVKKHRAA